MDKQQDNILYSIYIGGLVFKEAGKQLLTDKELEDLAQWRESNEHRKQLFEQIQDRQRVVKEIRRLNDKYDAEAAVERIFVTLSLDKRRLKNKVHRIRVWKWSLSAAAAAIFIILGAWFYVTRQKGFKPIAPSSGYYQNDIRPGGNKAVLTLSGGNSIALDGAPDGILSIEEGTRIEKTADGKLAYSPAKDAAAPDISRQASLNTLTTPRGGQYFLELPDGSKVWLNSASSIRYPVVFTGKSREVELKGEAYFEITSNADHPFKVKVGELSVDVLGTSFNINAYGEEGVIRTTVLEGGVKVSLPKDKAAVLAVNEQAVCNPFSHDIQLARDIDPEDVIAWKNGLFQFNNASIESIMRQVGRWYDADIVYTKGVTHRFSGEIPRDVPVSTLLKMLESTRRVHFRVEGKTITVMP